MIKFFRRGDRFFTQATGQGAAEIFAESESRFFLKVVDGGVEFVKDAAGKVTGMVLTQNGQKLPAKRISPRYPGLKPGVLTGLILSGASSPEIKIGVRAPRTYREVRRPE